jgi:hypothetical protein
LSSSATYDASFAWVRCGRAVVKVRASMRHCTIAGLMFV